MPRHTRRIIAFVLALLLTLWSVSAFAQADAALMPEEALSSEEEAYEDEEDAGQELSPEEIAQSAEALQSLSQDEGLSTREKLDAVFKDYRTMGASVAVFQNGEITYTYTYGIREKESGEPVTEDTLFQVGSISKMIAGIGLLRLVEDGKAELDSDLGDLFGFPVRNPRYPGTPVTLRQLMSHTAGIRDSGQYKAALNGRVRPLSALLGGNAAEYSFSSGTRGGERSFYSNFGGGIGGSLVEALSGQTLDGWLTEAVFAPLGITAGYQASLLPAEVKLADMYEMPSRRRTKALRTDLVTHITAADPEQDYFLSAGKLIISAPDLAKILIALCDGGMVGDTRILKESSAREMRTPQNYRGSVKCDSQRGLFMNIIRNFQVEGRTMYGHGGKANGMLCAAYFDPVDRTGIVMLTNGCNNRPSYHGVGMLGRTVLSLCYSELIDGKHITEDPWLVED